MKLTRAVESRSASQQLPEGYLFPGTNPRQCLTPENAYTLEDFDILVGLDWIRSNTQPPQQNEPIRYFLMPTCFRWVFEKNSDQPQKDSDYKQMHHSLNCLLKDAAENSKIPVIIAGILNLDKNHYINYFVVWNAKVAQISIFILDPSAEKEKGSKKSKELHFAELIQAMLWDKGQNIVCYSFSVIQQLREKDCGFLCLQNLEDLVIGRKLAILTQEGLVSFDRKSLTVYGNSGRKYDKHNKMYIYRAQILDQDLSVRATWASRMMGEPSAPVTSLRMFPLKDNPTLDDALESVCSLEPYDYSAKVKQQFDNDILGQARSTICALFTVMRVRGVNVLDACVAQYNNDFVLPSDSDVAEYTQHLRSRIKPIKVQGRIYKVEDLDLEFGSLDYVVYDSIMDLLRRHHATALLIPFRQFLQTYHWETAVEWKAKIIDDFFASENIQHIVRLLKQDELSTVKESCKSIYEEDLNQRFLQYMRSQFPDLLRFINNKSSATSLIAMMQDFCKFTVEKSFQRVAVDIQTRLRDAILLRARALLTHAVPQIVSELKGKLFSEEVSLIERLRMNPSRWHSMIQRDSIWKGFLEHFPNTTAPFVKQIDQEIEVFILALLDRKIHDFINQQSCARLLEVGDRDSSRDLQWQAFSTDILHLEEGVELPRAHRDYYLQRFVTLVCPQMQRLQNSERHFVALIQHLEILGSACAGKVQGFDAFLPYISALPNQMEAAKLESNTESFKAWLVESQRSCLAYLNPLLKTLVQHFEPGCTDPHHITYVLRPILARLFNFSIQRDNKNNFSIIYDLEVMTRVDLAIKRCLLRGLSEVPATLVSDLLILAHPSTVDYSTFEQLHAAHLVSMIHIIDSDLYQANSLSFWFNYLKPLRNGLISVLQELKLGPNGLDVLIPQDAFEALKDLINETYRVVLGDNNTPAAETLGQLLGALRKHAGLDPSDEDLERSNGAKPL